MKDIVLGQYINGDSPIHRLDPRLKLIVSLAYIVLLFCLNRLTCIALLLLLVLVIYAVVRIPFKLFISSLKTVAMVVLLTAGLNMFFVEGEVLVSFWRLSITKEGLYYGATLSLRVIALLAGTSLLTYTTTPIQLTNAMEALLSPLAKLNVSVHDIAMMTSIAIRFIPDLLDETQKIMSAQKSRGADIDTGSFTERVKSLTPILVPLFVSAFRRADDLALAMECRCYTGEGVRTKLHPMQYSGRDLIAFALFTFCFVGLLMLNKYICVLNPIII